MNERQVFSTMSPRRWRIVKTTAGVLLGITIIGLCMFITTLAYPNKPELPKNFNRFSQSLEQVAHDTTLSWQQQAANGCCSAHQPLLLTSLSNPSRVPMAQQIRAAYYVNWDQQSYFSLEKNISQLNTLVPNWLFMDSLITLNSPLLEDTVTCTIDVKAFELLKNHRNISVIPTLTNFFDGKLNVGGTEAILNDSRKRTHFIESIVKSVKRYGFQGVNLDFEDLEDEWIPNYYAFADELYHRLHTEGLILAQVLVPYNQQISLDSLQAHSDLIFVEALNQHYETGQAGAIADLGWVEKWMKSLSEKVSKEKMVLAMPAFGLDWSKKGKAPGEMTYRVALSIAEEVGAKIKFNPASYHFEYEYADDDNISHKVFFADAVTNFNQIRMANDMGWRGVMMHRLGSEDSRLWEFFGKDLGKTALDNGSFDINTLSTTIIPEDVEYVGDGEVMDVISENPAAGAIRLDYDKTKHLIVGEYYDKLPTSFVVQKFGKNLNTANGERSKKLVLTFDDGPDPKYTPQVLDILKKEKVPGAFFLIGKNAEANPSIVKRIFDEGHEIGNHTYFHPKLHEVYKWRAEAEMRLTRRTIESITGSSTLLFRPPYNPYTEPRTVDELYSFLLARHNNYLVVSESIDPLDWKKDITTDDILKRIIEKNDLGYGHIVLLHDAGGERDSTIKALPRIIRHFKNQGYEFVTIADLMGKSRAEIMPSLVKTQKPLIQVYRAIASFIAGLNDTLKGIFYIAMVFGTFRMFFVLYFALKQFKVEKNLVETNYAPPLSIIVPAYNEEVGAVSTVASLLNQNYSNYEVVFVDDGSKDKTYEVVKEAYKNHPQVTVMTKPNGGKASALNYGLKRCKNEFVVCIDADTILDPNALKEIAKPFADPKVGAVAGNVIVGNQVNMLTKWQSIEYVTAQNFDRMAFAYLNCITVVPGAIGAFRRQAIGSVGWYETDTLAEDCDLTVRIISKGYRVTHNNKSIAITESPETYQQFLKQRLRWCFGVMQAFWKNKQVLFNRQYGALGWVAFPNILFFGLLFPILSPIADFTLVFNLVHSIIEEASQDKAQAGAQQLDFFTKYHMLIMYLGYMLIDISISAVAFIIQKEPLWKLWLLFPQRFVYRPLSYYILIKSYVKALKGELMGWGVLKRTGSMGQVTVKQQEAPVITQQDIELNRIPSVG